ncbi:MAG: nicotinamide riboside transporter PnuC [Saprospiraceae bacterium]|nr:nicotinamide riboside transporter PnuC [Saprospiraceae bacterium]
MSLLEWAAVFFNVLYVVLAARRHVACWPAGIVGVILAFLVYVPARLYSDALLQVFYLLLSIYGWWEWSRGPSSDEKPIIRMPVVLHIRVIGAGIVLGLGMGFFWSGYGAALPLVDGMTTSFSMVTTWLVAKRYLENWIYWIIIDLVCIGVYLQRGIDAFVILFMLYVILSFWGWRTWNKALAQKDLDQMVSSD